MADNASDSKTRVTLDAASATTDAERVRLENAVGSRYRIEELLGRGQFSSTYRAARIGQAGEVALKLLDLKATVDPELVRRLEHALRISGSPDVGGVVAPITLERYETATVFVMPLVRGGNLAALIAARGALPLAEVEKIVLSLAKTLDELHKRGVAHRGLTPENVLFDSSGRPCITDVGVTDTLLSAKGSHGSRSSSAGAYAAPEQRRSKKVDGRADQYALAVIAYELLTGARRLDGELLEGIHMLPPIEVQADARLRKDIPLYVNAALRRALSANTANRFATSTQFAESFAGLGTTGHGLPTARARLFLTRRNRIAGAVGGIVVVFVIFALADPALMIRAQHGWNLLAERVSLPQFGVGLSVDPSASSGTSASGSANRSPAMGGGAAGSTGSLAPPSRAGASNVATSNANAPLPPATSSRSMSGPRVIRAGSSTTRGGDLPNIPDGKKSLSGGTAILQSAWSRVTRTLGAWLPRSQSSAAFIQVTVDRGTALVTIDGIPRGLATVTSSVDPGHHIVTVQGSLEYQPSTQGINASPGDTARVTFRGVAKP